MGGWLGGRGWAGLKGRAGIGWARIRLACAGLQPAAGLWTRDRPSRALTHREEDELRDLVP